MICTCSICGKKLDHPEVSICKPCKGAYLHRDAVIDKAIADRDSLVCNHCRSRVHTVLLDHEALCDSCAVKELCKVVERLSTAWVSVTAEVLYETE